MGVITLKQIITGLLVTLLAGCAQFAWYHPNKNQNDFNMDKYNCERRAVNMYPTLMIQQRPDFQPAPIQAPSTTNCTNNFGVINCTTTPGQTFSSPAALYTPPPQDANANNRGNAISSCLQANGWELRPVDNRPQPQYSQPTPAINKNAGESCSRPSECSGNLWCVSGRCAPAQHYTPVETQKPKLSQGGVCKNSTDCESNMLCMADRCVISAKTPAGEACWVSAECVGTLMCESGKCVQKTQKEAPRRFGTVSLSKQEGESCNDKFECSGTLVCDSGRCASPPIEAQKPKLGKGAACNKKADCEDDMWCIGFNAKQGTAGRCIVRSQTPVGEACWTPLECVGDLKCANGLCAK